MLGPRLPVLVQPLEWSVGPRGRSGTEEWAIGQGMDRDDSEESSRMLPRTSRVHTEATVRLPLPTLLTKLHCHYRLQGTDPSTTVSIRVPSCRLSHIVPCHSQSSSLQVTHHNFTWRHPSVPSRCGRLPYVICCKTVTSPAFCGPAEC